VNIHTPIGLLPADLWELIGQPVPEQMAAEAPTMRTASTDPPVQAQNQPDAQMVRPYAPEPANRVGATGWIQREEDAETGDQAAAGATALAAVPAAPAPGTENRAASEPDVEQLARRVYAEVRRRLRQELERMRR
jgi:hypothetical protein